MKRPNHMQQLAIGAAAIAGEAGGLALGLVLASDEDAAWDEIVELVKFADDLDAVAAYARDELAAFHSEHDVARPAAAAASVPAWIVKGGSA